MELPVPPDFVVPARWYDISHYKKLNEYSVADVSSTCYLAEWGCSVACKIF
jgi:hypothetical protein